MCPDSRIPPFPCARCSGSIPTWWFPPTRRAATMFRTSTRTTFSTSRRRWRSSPASRTTAASWSQGYHGTGKSTHIEQVAARLNWPCMRVNLDSHVSRIDLDRQGRDRAEATASRSPNSATASCPGRCQHNVALVLRRVRRRPPGRHVRHPARAGSPPARLTLLDQNQRDPPSPGLPPVLPRRTRSASATRRASITARSRSTRARWTAGRS